ncbi:alkane hydroxylase MAH1-like [Trifolium pratense]|uniref:alkane hydroxylase MAH1-like n=1 Tax=Trifolium pratense TaxID=57577 RepID=UPI001E695DFD|nr:alkane hydroxylase MAH1-like [Trifolium pratense]
MALFGSITIVCALFFFLCIIFQIHRRRFCRYPTMIDYPFLGMLPPLLWNLWHIHDFLTEELKKQHRSTGEFMGPWFTRMNYLVTSDPSNVHHIMSKCFANYVKGQEFHEIFEAFGDGIFNADSETWKYNRSLFHSIFKQRDFELFQEKLIRNKLERSLIPILDHVQQKGSVVDLQDVFNRFTFDNICSVVLGCDPNCLSIDFPDVACEKAFDQIEECIFYRHAIPKGVWILQKFLQVGQEKKMTRASKEFDEFIYASIESKREELRKGINNDEMGDLLTAFMKKEKESQVIVHDDKFLRDAAFNLFVAGRDTITSALTWLFYLVATHPLVETKILEEIKEKFGSINNIENKIGVDDVKKLVYLQGAICEAIRLFPPIPFERKQAIEGDILPSGHVVNPNTIILFSLYSMGRLEETWGKDCLEFKPERWISERGSIVHNPSYKFFGFNAGPRTCLGKDLSFIQIKMIAIAILCKYRVLLVEDHVPILSHSIVLLMKNGFKVRITKREI